MSKISIITINYNNLDGLIKTVESVVNQTCEDFEYIVIDGGSTDGSVPYIESQKERIDYWISEPDKGIYNAMNKGILKATGEYLLFLNSGDWLCDESVLVNIIYKLHNADVIFGNLVKVFSNGKKIIDKGPEGALISLNTFVRGTLNHGSSFIKRVLFYEYGFYDETLKIVSDWKFFLTALGLNNSNVKYIDIEISYFEMTGISNTNLDLRKTERESVLKELIPQPIYQDYKTLNDLQTIMNQNRFLMLRRMESSFVFRKMNTAWLKTLTFLINIKNIFKTQN